MSNISNVAPSPPPVADAPKLVFNMTKEWAPLKEGHRMACMPMNEMEDLLKQVDEDLKHWDYNDVNDICLLSFYLINAGLREELFFREDPHPIIATSLIKIWKKVHQKVMLNEEDATIYASLLRDECLILYLQKFSQKRNKSVLDWSFEMLDLFSQFLKEPTERPGDARLCLDVISRNMTEFFIYELNRGCDRQIVWTANGTLMNEQRRTKLKNLIWVLTKSSYVSCLSEKDQEDLEDVSTRVHAFAGQAVAAASSNLYSQSVLRGFFSQRNEIRKQHKAQRQSQRKDRKKSVTKAVTQEMKSTSVKDIIPERDSIKAQSQPRQKSTVNDTIVRQKEPIDGGGDTSVSKKSKVSSIKGKNVVVKKTTTKKNTIVKKPRAKKVTMESDALSEEIHAMSLGNESRENQNTQTIGSHDIIQEDGEFVIISMEQVPSEIENPEVDSSSVDESRSHYVSNEQVPSETEKPETDSPSVDEPNSEYVSNEQVPSDDFDWKVWSAAPDPPPTSSFTINFADYLESPSIEGREKRTRKPVKQFQAK